MTTSPNVPHSAFEMVGKRFDSHRRSVCIARSLIAGEGGGEGRRWIGSANGLRAILFEIVRVLNYARLKIDISFWPSSLPFYGTMEKIDRFFYGVGQPSEKISTKRVQFRLSFRTGGEGGDYVRSARVERSGRFSRTRERFG